MKPEFNHIYIRRFIVCNAFASWPLGACLLRMLRKLGTGKEDEEPENEKIGANQRVANEFTDRYFSQFSFSRSPLSLLVTLHCFVRRVVGVANLFLFWRFSILFSFFFCSFLFFFLFSCYNLFAIRCMSFKIYCVLLWHITFTYQKFQNSVIQKASTLLCIAILN